ncbi:hypothetical protein L198_06131 [Cryptococcus wingfieldii CBS 7118]|uniref:MPN domain-containing protein n=1 Tax=Cryptococcus wingfieldii CBS 7118 TaxID=1295528 RepID=A0A1E3IQD7_9TREE|nr:hypothetical protein L198_06131 [Cryptococcus wingfieldii CBS 7118]ODN90814.1 hypothetical protein L198_06131 [Cryptococcus wingfieldii CBS 7118]
MSSPYTYTLSPQVYALPILHAAAHPSHTTLGLLLSSSSMSDKEQTIDHAVPVLHNYASLSMVMEAALALVEEWGKGKGKRVVGVYVAREDGEGLGRVGERILAALRTKWDGAFGLVLDNGRLGSGQFAYIPYLSTASGSKAITSSSPSAPLPFIISSESLPAQLLQLIREKKVHRDVRDFDDHLEDSSIDWLENTTTVSTLQKYIS